MRRLTRIFISLIAFALAISPVTYGLYMNDWDVEAFFTPQYSPPRIDFDMEMLGYDFNGSTLVIGLLLENLGELDVTIDRFNVSVYASRDINLGVLRQSHPIEVPAGESSTLALYLDVDEDTIVSLLEYILSSSGYSFKLSGVVEVTVFSSKVYFPINMGLPFPDELLNSLKPELYVELYSVGVDVDRVVVVLNVSNPTLIPWRVEWVDLWLRLGNGTGIGNLALDRAVDIGPGSSELISVSMPIGDVDPLIILGYLRGYELRVVGTIVVAFETISVDISVDIPLGV